MVPVLAVLVRTKYPVGRRVAAGGTPDALLVVSP